MTYDLEKVVAAVLAVSPNSLIRVSEQPDFIVVDETVVVWNDGNYTVIETGNRAAVRSVLDELDRQDATGGA